MIKLLGFPFDANSSFLRGPALAPPLIRQMQTNGSANEYSEHGTRVVIGENVKDVGDLTLIHSDPKKIYEQIKEAVAQELTSDDKMIFLGGDHSVSYPLIESYSKVFPGLHVLHIDAHADLYDDFDTNPYSHASPFARVMEKGLVKSLTQVGIRTLNPHQREQAQRFGVEIVEMRNFSYNFIKNLKGPLYLSVDLDGLDPAFAPGVSHHEPGGLTVRELLTIIQNISVPLVGADIVEYNPTRDVNHMTAMVGYKVLKEIASKMLS